MLISAEELGIKEFVPAYLDTNLQAKDLATGVSFASGGAGFDPQTASLVVNFTDIYICVCMYVNVCCYF